LGLEGPVTPIKANGVSQSLGNTKATKKTKIEVEMVACDTRIRWLQSLGIGAFSGPD
jgi:hypothetical protein